MKLSSFLLAAILGTVQATPIAVPIQDISTTAVDIGDRSVLVKRLTFLELTYSAACWACMSTFYATAGYQLNFQQLQIPRSFYQTSLLFAGICEVTGPCGQMHTALDAGGVEQTYTESGWIAYSVNEFPRF